MANGQPEERRANTTQMAQDIATIKGDIGHIKELLGRVEDGSLCVYREKIQQASNNHTRLQTVEKQVQDNRVGLAQLLGAGGVGGAVVALAQLVLSALR